MNHAQRIRAAVKRARTHSWLILDKAQLDWRSADTHINEFSAAYAELEQIATELEQGWTREPNYAERAETEGELHD